MRDSKFIICIDPIGQSILAAEQLEDENGSWKVFTSEELAIIMITHLKAYYE
jgi:hypothetical protein